MAIVVRGQLERGVAVKRIARLLLGVLDEEVIGRRADLLPGSAGGRDGVDPGRSPLVDQFLGDL